MADVCVCGVPVAAHFTKRNRKLSCDEARRRMVLDAIIADIDHDRTRTIYIGPGECIDCRRGHHDRCVRTRGHDCECRCPKPSTGPRLRLVKSDRREVSS